MTFRSDKAAGMLSKLCRNSTAVRSGKLAYGAWSSVLVGSASQRPPTSMAVYSWYIRRLWAISSGLCFNSDRYSRASHIEGCSIWGMVLLWA